MTQLTQEQSVRLSVLRLVKNDAAAARSAIDFIGDNPLKLELFSDRYKEEELNQNNGYPVDRVSAVTRAIDKAKHDLHLFGICDDQSKEEVKK